MVFINTDDQLKAQNVIFKLRILSFLHTELNRKVTVSARRQ